ncbi:MAG: hypothetical protein ACQERB_01480 [Promethearchaeati archaeon]
MSEEYEITHFLNSNEFKEKFDNKEYNTLKKYKGKTYTGMRVGGKHYWNYDNGKWYEVKTSPEKWNITFNSIKRRYHKSPINSGASIGTKYHWYIIADQIAEKLDSNSYMTTMKGLKFKIGHQRPHWKHFSYKYPEQLSYKQRVIEILEKTLKQLKGESSVNNF